MMFYVYIYIFQITFIITFILQSLSSTPKKDKDEPMKNFKKNLDQEQEQALLDKVNSHEYQARVQIRKFKRQKLIGLHQLEQKLLKEVISLACDN